MSRRSRARRRQASRSPREIASLEAGQTPPPNVRAGKPPANGLDAKDRTENRWMSSDAAADRYNRVQWHETLRTLLVLGGVLIFVCAIALVFRVLGSDPLSAVTIIAGGAIGTVGAALRLALSRRRGGPPPV